MFKVKSLAKLIIGLYCIFFSLSNQAQIGIRNTPFTSQESADIENALRETISLWGGAWAAQLSDAYFDFYTHRYIAPEFATREDWMADRRRRIEGPQYIRIRLLDFQLVETSELLLGELLAVTRFTLVYERPGYSDRTYKELELISRNGEWRISRETNIRVEALDSQN